MPQVHLAYSWFIVALAFAYFVFIVDIPHTCCSSRASGRKMPSAYAWKSMRNRLMAERSVDVQRLTSRIVAERTRTEKAFLPFVISFPSLPVDNFSTFSHCIVNALARWLIKILVFVASVDVCTCCSGTMRKRIPSCAFLVLANCELGLGNLVSQLTQHALQVLHLVSILLRQKFHVLAVLFGADNFRLLCIHFCD